ncbi:hypothetical protein T8S45_01525 [Blastomonas marina]|uniref:hypothetical protein n=1 Tax=Blastomonas marina TaxID=1867408 RepID=UPI002AC9BE1E|nr:hypothetical protein [Blastomonas marina]WPZ04239.1 hypothetical protein T8S45_01525 [Blastomonas marina]
MNEDEKRANPFEVAEEKTALSNVTGILKELRDHSASESDHSWPVPIRPKDISVPSRDWFPEPEWMSGGDAFELLRLQCEPYEYAPAMARICQIISDQFDRDDKGLNYIIENLPPSHELLDDFPVGTPIWFRAMHSLLSQRGAKAIEGWEELASELHDWAAVYDSLRLRGLDVLDNALSLHWSVSELSLPETKQDPIWTFPRAMAWIATRDYLAMARMPLFTRPNGHEEPVAEDGVWRFATKSLGWLHSTISYAYCECGAVKEFGLSSFKHCTCISVAWEELVHLNGGLSPATPELVFNLHEGWISMTWPDGADDIRFLRRDILERWPPVSRDEPTGQNSTQSTANGEQECRTWLAKEFASDPEMRRSKKSFRDAALKEFSGRLSVRGFNLRVWPDLARQHGRDSAGAKRKS